MSMYRITDLWSIVVVVDDDDDVVVVVVVVVVVFVVVVAAVAVVVVVVVVVLHVYIVIRDKQCNACFSWKVQFVLRSYIFLIFLSPFFPFLHLRVLLV